MRKYHLYLLFFVGVFISTGCFEKESFPVEPKVSYEDFRFISSDSAVLVFNFTDGDGDVGLEKDNFTPPFDSSSYYHFNVYVEYYEKHPVQGWIPGTNALGDEVVFTFRISPIIPTKVEKSLKGVIECHMRPYYNLTSPYNDTIMYRFQLIDRALNESNWGETPPIVTN